MIHSEHWLYARYGADMPYLYHFICSSESPAHTGVIIILHVTDKTAAAWIGSTTCPKALLHKRKIWDENPGWAHFPLSLTSVRSASRKNQKYRYNPPCPEDGSGVSGKRNVLQMCKHSSAPAGWSPGIPEAGRLSKVLLMVGGQWEGPWGSSQTRPHHPPIHTPAHP